MKNLNWQAVAVIITGMALGGFLIWSKNDAAFALLVTNMITVFSNPIELQK